MDTSLLHSVNNLFARHDGLEDPLVAYAGAAEALFLVMLILAFLVARGPGRIPVRRAVVSAGFSAALGLAVAQVLSRAVDRPRPFVTHAGTVHLFAAHAADPGFPSDHATAAFAIGVALVLRRRVWGAVVLGFAAVLAVARVGMGVHYPTDVLGGAALGALAALVLWTPPLRHLLDRLADLVGGILDDLLHRLPRRPGATRTA